MILQDEDRNDLSHPRMLYADIFHPMIDLSSG